jgi:hypothetical protein
VNGQSETVCRKIVNLNPEDFHHSPFTIDHSPFTLHNGNSRESSR